jgi:hypothetical protein
MPVPSATTASAAVSIAVIEFVRNIRPVGLVLWLAG